MQTDSIDPQQNTNSVTIAAGIMKQELDVSYPKMLRLPIII